ncbi:hypothetical protein IW150_000813 [Coemansia sp. RSA 2607]|nr:hypothetical protein IW150_000813 [Coemansia sp. RSA 2607]
MSPPATPRGSIFSPRQGTSSWSTRVLTVECPEKRFKLDTSSIGCNMPMSPCGGPNSNVFVRTSTLAARRMKRMVSPSITPLQLTASAESSPNVQSLSTGLSPIISSLSIMSSTPKPSGLQIESRLRSAAPRTPNPSAATESCENSLPAMKFRLQKSVPAKSMRAKAATVPRLNIAAQTGLMSPPSATPVPNKRRPPALSFGALASPAIGGALGTAPLSPSVPQTPSVGGFSAFSPPNIDLGNLMFGKASPSFYDQPTPPPIAGAPSFFITPPSPAVVAVAAGSSSSSNGVNVSSSLAPCTPPWPKSGSNMQKTIFDHIGKNQLSPMDMRGYMVISMNS